MIGARPLLAAGLLAASLRAVQAGQGVDPRDPASRPVAGLRGLLRGPEIRPGAMLIAERDGRLRTLELDDRAPLRARLSIPF